MTERVLAGALDFAIVPSVAPAPGLRARPFARDREVLLSGPASGLVHAAPVRLADLQPLRLVLPSRGNTRRHTIDAILAAHAIAVEAVVELDAMIATIELVAASDWVTILPALICRPDDPRETLTVSPLVDPAISIDFMLIEPARMALSLPARLLLECLQAEVAAIRAGWDAAFAAV